MLYLLKLTMRTLICAFVILLTPLVIAGIGVGLIGGAFYAGIRYGANLPHNLLVFAQKLI